MIVRTSALTVQLAHRAAASALTSALPSSTTASARLSSALLATRLPQHQPDGHRRKTTLHPAEEKGHPKPVRTYSQLQRNVLALYRKAYRLIRTKPEGGGVSRKDFSAIEFLLRKGERTVEQVFGDPGVRDVHLPRAVIEEENQRQEVLARERGKEEQEVGRIE
ncbi:hypothetical protein OC861_001446 [Tilletia horrida]|nr:hypothetical protein OC861_001446 [Tilletia horrida]